MTPKSLWSLVVLFLMLLDYTEGWRRRRRRRCPVRNCAVSAWTKYSPCSQPCGNGGFKKRTRTVTRPGTCGGGCPYALVDIQPCNRGCPNRGTPVTGRCICKSGYSGRCCTGVNGGWSSWSSWKSCSKTCGSGVRVHTRTCTKPPPSNGGKPCTGSSRDSQACNRHYCPVNGGWSDWSRWSSCTKSCGAGSQERSRTCTRPPPSYGGKTCVGLTWGKQKCNRQPCPVHGGWSGWGVWTTCTKSCGSGTQTRSRSCTQPRPQHGGKVCPGALKGQRVCNAHSCPVNGGWSSWTSWNSCSKKCGSGVRERTRTCTKPPPSNGGKPCTGSPRKSQACNTHYCPVNGGWSDWSRWSSCTQSCEAGSQKRSRTCTRPPPSYGGKTCLGLTWEKQMCNRQPCPVHGGWSGWGVWTTCTKSCGSGTQTRSRSCTQPRPQHGGKVCPGALKEQRVCNAHSCPVNGGWSSWFVFTPCSVSCGTGMTVLARTCTNPAPRYSGRPCQGPARKGQRCLTKPCPIDGGWSRWSVWTTCTKSCRSGTQTRSRSCTQPPPQHGGRTCPGAARDQRVCNTQSCPVDGGWSNWGGWTSCSKSCGTGFKERFRSCTRPAPKFGGKPCMGEVRETHECNSHPCPVHGGWSVWSSWSSCAKTCGGGARERTRSCTNPPPFHGGQGCGTQYYESKECAMKKCPVDGGWSVWSVWSSCSKSCGIGSQERSRSCTQPPPSAGGKTCPGKEGESRLCNSNPCPVDGGWSLWSSWTECSVTCGTGVVSRERKCDNPAPAAGGRSCQGHPRDVQTCNTTEICIDPVGCYRNFPSSLLQDLRNDISWSFPPFSKQMDKIVKKCAHLAKTKRMRFFGVENYGNCYGVQSFSPGNQLKTNRCNYGVGLRDNFYVYEITE
ncbi:hypothetical protein ABFA07_010097 [Porites harrisoni]